jgi:hypothetical protein
MDAAAPDPELPLGFGATAPGVPGAAGVAAGPPLVDVLS